MIQTQTDALHFFVGHIAAQAAREGVRLSDDECRMLHWSETEPGSENDGALVERLGDEISDEDYEAKIAGLIAHAFAVDTAADPDARSRWQQAWATLDRGDHYLLVMVNQAVGRALKPWWRLW
jgi:hypothetical protein